MYSEFRITHHLHIYDSFTCFQSHITTKQLVSWGSFRREKDMLRGQLRALEEKATQRGIAQWPPRGLASSSTSYVKVTFPTIRSQWPLRAGRMCRQTLNTHLTLTASWNASSSQSRSLCVNSLTSCYKRGTNCSKLDAILYSGKQRFAFKPTNKYSTPMT